MYSDDSREIEIKKVRFRRWIKRSKHSMILYLFMIVLNILYDFALLMDVVRGKYMDQFHSECKP